METTDASAPLTATRMQRWESEQARFEASGLSVREFCRQNNLGVSTFYQRRALIRDSGAQALGEQRAAEDSESILFLVNEVLSTAGAIVTCVGNGQLALASLRAQSSGFDAVLIDIQMPVMDGIACTRAIRADKSMAELPIIAMTAGSLETLRSEILAAGANIVLAKPIKIDELAKVVSQQVARSNA